MPETLPPPKAVPLGKVASPQAMTEGILPGKPRPLRRSRARFPLLSPAVTSSPGAGEVFPLRESQGLRLDAKVLGAMRKLPAVLLALPLGELSPKVTERAHVVSPIVIVSKVMSNLLAAPEAPSPRELAKPSGFD